MQQVILNCFFTALFAAFFCNGLKLICEDGQLLHGFEKWASRLPRFIEKPLIDCVICMASVWGSLIYLLISFISVYFFGGSIIIQAILYLPCIIITALFNLIIYRLTQ